MSEAKNTPLPWSVNTAAEHCGGRGTIIWGPKGPGYGAVCYTFSAGLLPSPEQLAEAEANAALIVRTVNTHAALLAACEKMLARHEQALLVRMKLTGISTGALADEIAQARAAIAAAKGI